MSKNFVPDDFVVPEILETERLRLRMLTIGDVVKDYEAVMTSREHLRSLLNPEDKDTWPEDNMTIEEDLRDLERHQREFLTRKAFAYTVVSLDEGTCLGCVYINPSHVEEYDAAVYLWARQSELQNGLEEYLYHVVQEWVKNRWLFQRAAYPGRETSWAEWNSLSRV
ncbi:MAG: GNAT family N-acetyltransferase [Caulobacteraceae bacterium]